MGHGGNVVYDPFMNVQFFDRTLKIYNVLFARKNVHPA